MADELIGLPIGGVSEPSLQVVASSGANMPWSFEEFIVSITTPDLVDTEPTRSDSADAESGRSDFELPILSTPGGGEVLSSADADLAGFSGDADGTNSEAVLETATGTSSLEIFTPPAVRPGRADAIRAAVANRKP